MKHGRSNNGRRGRDRAERGGGSAGASAARGVPSNFSAVVAPTVRVGVRGYIWTLDPILGRNSDSGRGQSEGQGEGRESGMN